MNDRRRTATWHRPPANVLSLITNWTPPLWISRFGASHGFYTETEASAKTANKFGTAANIEAFDAKWRCPAMPLSIAGSISDGLIVVDLVKDPVLKGSLTRSTTPVIDHALLRIKWSHQRAA